MFNDYIISSIVQFIMVRLQDAESIVYLSSTTDM